MGGRVHEGCFISSESGLTVSEFLPWGGALSTQGKPEIVILGVPYDAMSTNRKGASAAPKAIRDASSSRSINPCTEEGANLGDVTRLADGGDLVLPEDPEGMAQEVWKATTQVLAAGAAPILLGGDHSITPPAVEAVAAAHGKIDILYLDAHPDLYETYLGSSRTHASSAYLIAKKVSFGKFLQVGVRMPSSGHLELAPKLGIKIVTAYNLVGPEDLWFENPLYLSIDVDCLDPAFAPGVGNPVPGGLSSRELLDILKSISGNVVAADVVEVVPRFDVSEITATVAARLVIETAGLITGIR